MFSLRNQLYVCICNLRSDQISIIDDLAFAMYQDPEIASIIRNLDRKKQQCVHGKRLIMKKNFIVLFFCVEEKYEQARKYKQAIQELIKVNLFDRIDVFN